MEKDPGTFLRISVERKESMDLIEFWGSINIHLKEGIMRTYHMHNNKFDVKKKNRVTGSGLRVTLNKKMK